MKKVAPTALRLARRITDVHGILFGLQFLYVMLAKARDFVSPWQMLISLLLSVPEENLWIADISFRFGVHLGAIIIVWIVYAVVTRGDRAERKAKLAEEKANRPPLPTYDDIKAD